MSATRTTFHCHKVVGQLVIVEKDDAGRVIDEFAGAEFRMFPWQLEDAARLVAEAVAAVAQARRGAQIPAVEPLSPIAAPTDGD